MRCVVVTQVVSTQSPWSDSCDAGDDDDGEDDNDDDDTTADEDSLTLTRNQVPGRVRVCIHWYLVNPCRSPFPGCWVPSLPMWRIRHLDF